MKQNKLLITLLCTSVLAACGGGGSNYTAPTPPPVVVAPDPEPEPTGPTYEAGVFAAESTFAAKCETPRTGTDPYNNNQPYPDAQGSTLEENHFLRSWSNNTYLWYNEITDQDPANFNDPKAYFDTLKTEEITASGTAKDNFHFTYATEEWNKLSQSGVSVSYGFDFVITQSTVPRQMVVTFVEPNAPSFGEVFRGSEVVEIDGVDLVNTNSQADIDILNAALSPSAEGESHEFKVRDAGSEEIRTITVTAAEIEESTVPIHKAIDTADGKVGYLMFSRHRAPAEKALYDAVTDLAAEGINDLVLDLRYNGGGYLAIAAQLGYMIAGKEQTDGQIFDKLTFNDKHPTINPVTGRELQPTPFIDQTIGFSVDEGTSLPTLDLSRVYILATDGTCSASEAIINGLRGIDVEVILLGDTTCGKPYGFYATDNCGTSYFTIQFKGENAKGFGEYSDGFYPMNKPSAVGESVEGCFVEDDYFNQLGDSKEAMLAAALEHRVSMTCPDLPSSATSSLKQRGIAKEAGPALVVEANPFDTNRILNR